MVDPTKKDKKEPIYLIDGHGYIFRAYYAVRQLATSTGFSTNALFGFCNMLVLCITQHKSQPSKKCPIHMKWCILPPV